MSVTEIQNRMKARLWQAIAQEELDLSGLSKETREALIELVIETAMLELDEDLGASLKEAQAKIEAADLSSTEAILSDGKEDLLWEGRPFLSISLHYTITDERIRITEGFLGKARENIELIRIQDVDYSQTFTERILKVGDINIRSHDSSHPAVTLNNIKDPEAVYEILRRAVLHARKKHNFTYREEM